MAARAVLRPTRRESNDDILGDMRAEWQAGAEDEQTAKRTMREYADLMPEPGFGPLSFEMFPFQEEWYSEEVANAEEVVFEKGAQVGACLDPETRVLCADLRWRRIADLEVGQEVVAVDESHGSGRNGARRTRRAEVEACWEVEEPAVRLTFGDGTSVIASESHRFLWRRRSIAKMRWERAGNMRAGDRIRRLTGAPWGEPTFEDGWFGGMIDGEGSLRMRTPANGGTGTECVVTQNRGLVLDRMVAYLAERGYGACAAYERPNDSGTVKGRVKLSRLGEVLRLIGTTRPTRFVGGDCPDGRWWEGRRLPQADGTAWATVVSVEPVGMRRLVDVQTSAGTFIAEGLVSHNSGMGVRWVIRQVDQFSDTGLYVMPSLDDVFEFGDERVEPAIEESDYLRSRIKGKFVRNKRLKRIGRGFLHMRGSNSKGGAQSVAATFLFLDERDLLDQTNVPHILRRVSGAVQRGKVPKIRHAGYPLLPNTGIDALFQSSDQRIWHVTCSVCGEEQPITWEENMRWTMPGSDKILRPGADEFEDRKEVGHVWRQCRSCEATLEDSSPAARDGALRKGRWIPKRPGAGVIGFHVWRGMVPQTDLKALVVASRATSEAEKEAFAALDLGRAYVTGDSSLNDGDLLAAMTLGLPAALEAYTGPNPTTMGIDVAGERDLNVQIDEQLPAEAPGALNPRRTLWVGTCKTFEEVAALIERFRVHVAVVDANPERRMAKLLRKTFPGRVVLCEYNPTPTSESIDLKFDDAGVPLKVTVNRTDAIDGMMDAIRQLRSRPLQNPPAGWMAQMKALVRRTELDTKDRPVRRYVTTGTDGDDYAHTATYALVATELWRVRGGAAAQIAAQQPRPLPDREMGFKRVRLAGEGDSYDPGFGERA